MPITILQPRPAPQPRPPVAAADSSDSDSDGGVDVQGDVSMHDAASKKRRRAGLDDNDEAREILTPGSVITTNSQWMR